MNAIPGRSSARTRSSCSLFTARQRRTYSNSRFFESLAMRSTFSLGEQSLSAAHSLAAVPAGSTISDGSAVIAVASPEAARSGPGFARVAARGADGAVGAVRAARGSHVVVGLNALQPDEPGLHRQPP